MTVRVEWQEVPDSRMEDLLQAEAPYCLPENNRTTTTGIPVRVTDYVIGAESGGVWDVDRQECLVLIGGGHNDWYYNFCLAYRLGGGWRVLRHATKPPGGWGTMVPAPDLPGIDCATYHDGQPSARHTYGGVRFDRTTRRAAVFSGSRWRDGTADPRLWLLDMETLQWSEGAPMPRRLVGIATAHDEDRNEVLYHDTSRVRAYSFRTNTYRDITPNNQASIGGRGAGTVDRKRQRVYFAYSDTPTWMRSYRLDVLNPGLGAHTKHDLTGDTDIMVRYGIGFVEDPEIDRIVCWHGGRDVVLINKDTGVMTKVAGTGANPGLGSIHGPYGLFARLAPEEYVLLNRVKQNVFRMRLWQSTTMVSLPGAMTAQVGGRGA